MAVMVEAAFADGWIERVMHARVGTQEDESISDHRPTVDCRPSTVANSQCGASPHVQPTKVVTIADG